MIDPNENYPLPANPQQSEQPKKFNWTLFFSGIAAVAALTVIPIVLFQWLIPFNPVTDSPLKKILEKKPLPGPQNTLPPSQPPEPAAPPTKEPAKINPPEEASDFTIPLPLEPAVPATSLEDFHDKNHTITVTDLENLLPPSPEEQPSISTSETVEVTDTPYVNPRNATPKRNLYLPRVPTDSLLSFMADKKIIAEVRVDEQGKASVTHTESHRLTPDFIVQEAVRIIQESEWNPAIDSRGNPTKEEITIIFFWKR